MEALMRLQDIVKKHTLLPYQRQKIAQHLLLIADTDADEQIRSAALHLLWSLGETGEQMQQVLVRALRRSSSEARLAIELLPQIASPATWRTLMDAFGQEEDPVVQYRLLEVLPKVPYTVWQDLCERIGHSPKRWQPLVTKLSPPPSQVRSQLVAWALSEHKPLRKGALLILSQFPPLPSEAEKLKPLSRSDDEETVQLVFRIWAQAPSPKLIPELRSGLRRSPEAALFASAALLKLGALPLEEGRKLLQHPLPSLRAQGALALAPSRALSDWQALQKALKDPSPEVVQNAAIALVAKGAAGLQIVLSAYARERAPERRAALLLGMASFSHPKVFAALVQALRSGHWQERGAALTGLVFHKDNALPALERLLLSANPQERISVVEALKAIQTPKALQMLLRIARSDPNLQVRCEAALALSNHGVKEAMAVLADIVEKGDEAIANTAAFGLTRYGEEGRQQLREMLRSERPTTRYAAARALATLNDRAALHYLQQQANQEDLAQRITILQLMARAGDEKALRELLGLLTHEDPLIRLRARLGLYAVGKPAIPLLLQALDSADNRLRAEAALVLGAMRASIAKDKLVPLLKDSDPAVRAAAAQALQRLEQK